MKNKQKQEIQMKQIPNSSNVSSLDGQKVLSSPQQSKQEQHNHKKNQEYQQQEQDQKQEDQNEENLQDIHQDDIELNQRPNRNNKRKSKKKNKKGQRIMNHSHQNFQQQLQNANQNNGAHPAQLVEPAQGQDQAQPNMPQNPQNPVINIQPTISKKTILKWLFIISLLIFSMWLGLKFLTDTLARTRHPMFLSSFSSQSKTPQAIAPQQSDYQSFKYYKKMIAMSSNPSVPLSPSSPQLSQFSQITFKQFLNTYKVIRTIQLSKQFSSIPKPQSPQSPSSPSTQPLSPQSLQTPTNKTSYFLDAVNQFGCGSCYSFPIAATVQYMYRYWYNITVKLSEQQLIDCAHDERVQANGCQAGNITRGFQYVRDVGLVETEQYPYRSITGVSYKCDRDIIDNKDIKKYKISGFKILPTGSCQSIQAQLFKNNVVASMMSTGDLSSYTQGTFTDCKRFGLNHAITIVGQTEKNQWIVRNSWGRNWANNGYFVMGHGNTCGVCTHAIVPILKMEGGQVMPWTPEDQKKAEGK